MRFSTMAFWLRQVILALLLFAGMGTGVAVAERRLDHTVYVMTNNPDQNEVTVFGLDDHNMVISHNVATGGKGTGAGLGSQGSLVLSKNGRWLFAVNAGSNDVSVFRVRQGDLELVTTAPSGGEQPISLTVHNNLLYVLNAGGSGNISGFMLGHDGSLAPIDGSTLPLSNGGTGGSPAPAQIQFSPGGDFLVVTEKNTNMIDVYAVNHQGYASGPSVYSSAGQTPFGFLFDKRGHLIVSEAFGGAPGASATSSYALDRDGNLTTITPSAPTFQAAACWVMISKNGRYAYTTNTGSDNITGYRIHHDGRLTLLNPDGVTAPTGDSPIDMALTHDGRFLLALNANSHDISGFLVNHDGSLTLLATVGGLPAGAVGIAAW